MIRAVLTPLLALALPSLAQQGPHADAIEREQQQRAQQAEALRMKTEAAVERARPGADAPPPPVSAEVQRELDAAHERERRETAAQQQAPSANPETGRGWRIQLRSREEAARDLRR